MVLAALLRGAGGLVSVFAGWYLLSRHSLAIPGDTSGGQSWLEALAHGIGIYFIARGLYMLGSTLQSMETPKGPAGGR